MDEGVISLLEKRVAALELQVFDKNGDPSKNQVITDLLLQTHTMIASALSCRDNIVSILERLPRLNEYLNPAYMDNALELEARRQYVLEIYPELKRTVELVGKFNKLKIFADSPQLEQVTDLSQKLEKLTVENITINDESRKVTNDVLQALQKYNDISMSIQMLFAQMDKSVSELEYALEPKMKFEE